MNPAIVNECIPCHEYSPAPFSEPCLIAKKTTGISCAWVKIILIPALVLTFVSCKDPKMSYPETRKDDITDDYFGVMVPDPYRWLEDDMSVETAEWVRAQNLVTFDYLEQIPFRDKIRDRLEELWDYERMSAPSRKGDYYFYSYNNGLQNQDVIYKTSDYETRGEVFIDPNTFSDDGTVALTLLSISPDAKYAGYGISRGGSDWNEFFVKEVESGKTLDDHLKWIKFSSLSWYEEGFFYSRYPSPGDEGDSELSGLNQFNKLYYHKVGEEQDQDKLVFEDPEHPDRSFRGQVTSDERYLIISVVESTSGNAVYYLDLQDPEWEVKKIIQNFDKDFYFVGNMDDKLYFMTNHNAPMYRLVAIRLAAPAEESWESIIPGEADKVMKECYFTEDQILVQYEQDARSVMKLFSREGNLIHDIELPGIGSIAQVTANEKYPEAFFAFTSFSVPSEVYYFDTKKNRSALIFRPEVDFNPDNYVTNQVFYQSKDGTEIPMFIVHRKDLDLDGRRPTLLYGYGGFNISLTPSFSARNLIWLENDGIYAVANLRGGGEYGEKWHQAGTLLNKQNVFDDFIAAGEYLVNNAYTSSDRLAIFGGSNGGLLVGAVTNQRPDLFAVALPAVGVMDMLRFHKFTIGRYWVTDYGSSDNPEQFEYLYNYSPIHNISAEADYPAVFVSTADHDDRVVPAHSFKYIATLQEKYKGENPVLIRIETDAGHGAGKPVSKTLDEYADRWAFAFYNMDFVPEY